MRVVLTKRELKNMIREAVSETVCNLMEGRKRRKLAEDRSADKLTSYIRALSNRAMTILDYDGGYDSYIEEYNEPDLENGKYDDVIMAMYKALTKLDGRMPSVSEIMDELFGEVYQNPSIVSPSRSNLEYIGSLIATQDKEYSGKAMDAMDATRREYNGYAQGHLEDDYWKKSQAFSNDVPYYRKNAMKKWADRDLGKEYPDMFRKNGEQRSTKTLKKNLTNRSNLIGAMVTADEKPLHRKGSLNRA